MKEYVEESKNARSDKTRSIYNIGSSVSIDSFKMKESAPTTKVSPFVESMYSVAMENKRIELKYALMEYLQTEG